MDSEPWVNWEARWEEAATACVARGGERWPFVIEPPATEDEVDAIQRVLGSPVPSALRRVLLGFSRRVSVRWSLPSGGRRPAALDGVFAGECSWSLEELPRVEANRNEWVRGCFTNRGDPYDRIWHDKFAVTSLVNGDVIAIDRRVTEEPVIYLSHEYGPGHGKRMGGDFITFVDEHTKVACMGPDDWQWMRFHRPGFGIDGSSENALALRTWLDL